MSEVSVKTVKKPALQIVTGTGGAMLSKVIAPHVPGGPIGKIVLALGMGVIAAVVPPKTTAGKSIQAAAIGAGVIQLTEGASEMLAPIVQNWADSGEPSKLKDLAKKTVGLSAADSSYYEQLLLEAANSNNGKTVFPEDFLVENQAPLVVGA